MFDPVPSHRLSTVLGMTASEAPRASAYSTIKAFSAYDVVFSPAIAPFSFRAHGTVTIVLVAGGRGQGSVITTIVGVVLPRGEPSGPIPEVNVIRIRPNSMSGPAMVAVTPSRRVS